MKILPKIMLGFMIVVLISIVSGVYTIMLLKGINSDISKVTNIEYPINQQSTNYQRGANLLWIGTYVFANGDIPMGNQYITHGKKLMSENRELLSNNIKEEVIDELLTKELKAIEASDRVVSNVNNPNYSKDKIILDLNFLQQRVDALNLKLSSEVDKSQEIMIAELSRSNQSATFAISITVYILIISVILSLVFSLILALQITRPIKQLTNVTDMLSKGELKVVMPVIKSKDEIYNLNESIKGVLAAVQFLKDEVEKNEGKQGGK